MTRIKCSVAPFRIHRELDAALFDLMPRYDWDLGSPSRCLGPQISSPYACCRAAWQRSQAQPNIDRHRLDADVAHAGRCDVAHMWRVHASVAVVGFSIRSWRERPNPLPLVAVNTSSPAIRLFEGWRTARARREATSNSGSDAQGTVAPHAAIKQCVCFH